MTNKIYLAGIALLLFITGAYAQKDTLTGNKYLLRIATPFSNANRLTIRPDTTIDPLTFFSTQKKALDLGTDDDMRLYQANSDKTGLIHYRYQQYYKGYKIIYGEFLLHATPGKLIRGNGKMIRGLNKRPSINISKQKALQNALQLFPAAKYAWEIPQLENNYKDIHHDTSATYYPTGEIVWISKDDDSGQQDPASYELAYLFDIYTASLDGKRFFISVANGKLIKSFPLVYNCTGTAVTTNFNGFQGFSTREIPGSGPASFNLWNDCQAAFIHTRNWNTDLAKATDFTSALNNNWNALASAATSHWAIERTYDFYLSIFERKGWNNADGGINIYQNALFPCTIPPSPPPCPYPNNASFGNGTMLVGNAGTASTIDDFNALDIIAHEFTHGVTETSANLVYSKEPGALNESFSDILGVSCYAWFNGLNANKWLLGFDRKNPNNTSQSLYIRNMANPGDRGDPDTYLSDPKWISTTTVNPGNDSWGVHTNSGVQNFMYYLLVSGGTGTNDNGTPYSLIGIGISAAREIAYRALTNYLTATSTFADAREAWVLSAEDLYGLCSLQAIETGKAWDAVGLPPPSLGITAHICGDYGITLYSVVRPDIYSLSPDNCNMRIFPSSLVEFGSDKVILNPGFHALPGSHFRAYVSDCRYAAHY
ncbi:MAG: M4 family metallopeptidase [Ferruginibacter sp.]